MTQRISQHAVSATALAVLLITSLPTQAIQHGIDPTLPGAPPVVNPFTGLQTEVWKFVGFNGRVFGNTKCSGFRITREWIGNAIHCSTSIGQTGPFTDYQGKQSYASTCANIANSDLQICRLSNPEALTTLSNYPALSVSPAPKDPMFAKATATKWGSLMLYGRSHIKDGLAFSGFDGLPYGYNPALEPNAPPIPYSVDGDSGGAAYWFAPNAATPVLVGSIRWGTPLQQSPHWFTQANLDAVKAIIVSHGDPAPALLTSAQYYPAPPGNPAPEFWVPPTLTLQPSSTVLAWTPPLPLPADTPAVSAYEISLGNNGTLVSTQTVSPGQGNSLTYNNLPRGKYIACVTAINSVGRATVGWQGQAKGCARLDSRLPQATVTALTGSSVVTGTGLRKVTFTWTAPTPVPADLPIASYRLSQSISYPTGPARVSTATVTSTNTSFNVPQATKVCVAVEILSQAAQSGPKSAQVCTTAN